MPTGDEKYAPGTRVRHGKVWHWSPDIKHRGPYNRRDLEYYQTALKSGRPGKRFLPGFGPWYTELQQCGRCGRWGSPKKVHYRSDCHGYNYSPGGDEGAMCMTCWNRVRPLVRRRRELEEIKALINKVKRARKQ